MREFWLRSAYLQFKTIDNPHEYDRRRLVTLIPKIRAYSRDERLGLAIVLKALYHHGVTVIFQPSLPGSGIRGATFCIDGKPCVVISDHFKKYSTLWFSLMHELYHVLYDLDDIVDRTFHISGEGGDLFLTDEERADRFARDFFMDDSRRRFITPLLGSKLLVEKQAKAWGIHPSLIYAIHCYEHKCDWRKYSNCIPSSDVALTTMPADTFDRETLQETAEIYKHQYETV